MQSQRKQGFTKYFVASFTSFGGYFYFQVLKFLLLFLFKCFWRTRVIYGPTYTPVLDFWGSPPWASKSDWSPGLCVSVPVHAGLQIRMLGYRFTCVWHLPPLGKPYTQLLFQAAIGLSPIQIVCGWSATKLMGLGFQGLNFDVVCVTNISLQLGSVLSGRTQVLSRFVFFLLTFLLFSTNTGRYLTTFSETSYFKAINDPNCVFQAFVSTLHRNLVFLSFLQFQWFSIQTIFLSIEKNVTFIFPIFFWCTCLTLSFTRPTNRRCTTISQPSLWVYVHIPVKHR